MSLLGRLLGRSRLVDEAGLVLSVALLGAGAGLIVAALALPPTLPPFSTAPGLSRWVLAIAPGFGFGWWGALLWGTALACHARRLTPRPPVATLATAGRAAALVVVATAAAARASGVPLGWGVAGGVLVATLAARVLLGRAAGQVAP